MGVFADRLALSFVKTNARLRSYFSSNVAPRAIRERRANAGICAIDDEPFAPQQNLRNYGYNIIPIGDIKNVEEVATFDIILCDLMGVGQYLDNKLQGASIIAEIRRTYPEKYVIAYTGAAMSAIVAKQATSMADETLRKDIDIEEWVSVLDRYTDAVQDPHKVWERIRRSLIDRSIDTRELILLESGYVRSVLSGDRSFSALENVVIDLKMQEDVRSILNGIISSIAFSFLFGR